MKISTIIPVYNASKFLDKCINSILAAQIVEVKNEIIIVNDGSTDTSLEICERYAKDHKNIKVYSQENQGPSVARNLGIKEAVGDYVTFVDSDDYVEKEYLESIIFNVNKFDEPDIMVYGYYKTSQDKKKELYQYIKFDQVLDNKGILEVFINTKDHRFLLFPVNKIYKRELITSSFNYDSKIRLGEDVLFNMKLFHKANSVVFIKEALYNYFDNPYSVTNQKYKPNLIEAMELSFMRKIDFYTESKGLNKPIYFKDIARINLENTFFDLLGNTLSNKKLTFSNEMDKIRNTELIKFGFHNLTIMEIKSLKNKIILLLFKYRAFKVLELLYKRS